ncbi:MAG: muconolactone Delta-isomerase family protein [Gammaproteobacteria bacterium]|nr:muconolactone Delta-isomerase family protein [Gammaproteobacteria bacterium]
MKFLVTIKSRIGAGVAKPADPAGTFKKAREWNKKGLESGVFDCVYGFATGRGGISIINANTHEELMNIIRSSPMFHFMDYEVHPLCDPSAFWTTYIDALEKTGSVSA